MSNFFSWRSAFQKSELPSTTKLVLFCISTYMNDHGEGAYPNIETLMKDASLSNKAVITHIQNAQKAGFLSVNKHGFSGQKWRRNEYKISYPDTQKVVNEVHVDTEKVVNLSPEGGEPHDQKVVNEVHTITPLITPKNSPIENYNKNLENENTDDQPAIAKPEPESTKQTKSKKLDDEFNQFWDAYSIRGIPSPKKGNRINAHKAFVKALRIITFDELMAALERYKKYVASQKYFGYNHASTWLNQSDWLTYPDEKTKAEVAAVIDWDLAVKTCKERGIYPAPGASPIDPRRCEAPTSVMIKYGYWPEVTA